MENTGQGLVSGGGWQAFLASFDCGRRMQCTIIRRAAFSHLL